MFYFLVAVTGCWPDVNARFSLQGFTQFEREIKRCNTNKNDFLFVHFTGSRQYSESSEPLTWLGSQSRRNCGTWHHWNTQFIYFYFFEVITPTSSGHVICHINSYLCLSHRRVIQDVASHTPDTGDIKLMYNKTFHLQYVHSSKPSTFIHCALIYHAITYTQFFFSYVPLNIPLVCSSYIVFFPPSLLPCFPVSFSNTELLSVMGQTKDYVIF